MFLYTKDEILEEGSDVMEWYTSMIHKEDLAKRTIKYEQMILRKIDNYVMNLRVLCKNKKYKFIKCFSAAVIDHKTNHLKRIINIIVKKSELIVIYL